MNAIFARGSMWVQLGVYFPAKPDLAVLTKFVNDQYGRLPSY